MKDQLEKTKVVLRHLPPSLAESALVEQIDSKFAGRYNWFCFRSGKNSQKSQCHSRAYLDFKSLEDVFEFAEFFDGHVFVNEKGTQFKVQVEYAPSQGIPKPWTKKDGREGSIFKDPEYLDFLELLAKPVENLPSAEIQLERREAERAGGTKEVPIVTPLMDFVRQKRAAKNGPQRASGNSKSSRRAIVSGSPSSKRDSDRRRGHSIMYVSRDNKKNDNGKEKQPTYILVPRRGARVAEESSEPPSGSGKDDTQNLKAISTNGPVSGVTIAVETGKKAVLLLKGKEREGSHIQRPEAPGKMIRSILSKKEGHQLFEPQSEQQLNTGISEKEKRPPRPPISLQNLKEHHAIGSVHSSATSTTIGKFPIDDKAASNESHASVSISDNKHDKRLRNKDRPDRGVWAPLRRSDGSHGHGVTFLSANEMPVGHGVIKLDAPIGSRSSESKSVGGRGSQTSLDNGTHRNAGRRGPGQGSKESDGLANAATEGKPSKRGPAGYVPHERQVWVQKSGSAS